MMFLLLFLPPLLLGADICIIAYDGGTMQVQDRRQVRRWVEDSLHLLSDRLLFLLFFTVRLMSAKGWSRMR